MKHYIYADNAATTKLDTEAFESMLPWLKEEYGNASQPYSFARKPKRAIAEARATIAACINALPEEIYFTSGGTESDNWAIKGAAFSDEKKGAIITSLIEHPAVLNACKRLDMLGFQIKYLTPDSMGLVEPKCLERAMLGNNVRLVSVMLANNEIGTIEPIAELAAIAHSHGALFHTDAVQAVGHIPIDVKASDVDMLSASAHKFNGPKGIGFLYIKKGIDIIPFCDGGSQEAKMRAGTENVAAIVGMATALKNNCRAIQENSDHIRSIEETLIAALQEKAIDFVRNGADNRIPGNVSLSFKGADGEGLLHRLDLMGICVSTGSACDSKNPQISHVLKAIALDEDYARGTIRISLCKYNTLSDAERIAAALCKILAREN